jgi:myo-inositol-1(or 4)-monophosphatase
MTGLRDLALDTARRAGRLLCDLSGRQHRVGYKSTEIDLVTEADMASEQLIVDAIRSRFSDHAILSEEGGGDVSSPSAKARHLWLVDPLDGTVNYAHGYPMWGVSLALTEGGQITLGVVYDPLRDELFWAERGQGAWLAAGPDQPFGTRLTVSRAARLQEALLATGFPYRLVELADNNLAEFNFLITRVQGVRRAGAAVLDMAHVAAGRLDGYWEKHLNPWDWAAGWLLVEEAGGVVTTLDGKQWSLAENNLAASNGLIHDQLLSVFHQAQSENYCG